MTDISIIIEIKAAPAVVFRWLTEQELLSRWLAPAVIAFPKKGTYAAFAFGNDVNFKVEIIELIENVEVKWRCVDGNIDWIGAEISFLLKAKDSLSTIIQFKQIYFAEFSNSEMWKNNWQYYLETLSDVLGQ